MTPTAEEFLKSDNGFDDQDMELLEKSLKTENRMDISDIAYTMIEFAKFHVKACKKAYFEEIKKEGLVTEAGIAYLENAYPIKNIK